MKRKPLEPTRLPTIVDVARLAGVSKSTVSNVIRDAACVAPAMRARVTNAVAALNYRPNVLARQLVQQRTKIFGAVAGDLANPFHAEMAKQIEQHAAAKGYRVMFVNTHADEVDEASLEQLLEYRVAGILFLAHAGMSERARLLATWGVDMICTDRIDLIGATLQLSDLSINGTFVRFSSEDEVVSLRRGSCTLHGSGEVGLSGSPEDPGVAAMQFEVLHAPIRRDDEFDLLETFEAENASAGTESGADQLERAQVLAQIDEEIQKLPTRQREAFLMRYWEDMDVAETAAAMGCSEGSVKTHCSRATHALATALRAKGITL